MSSRDRILTKLRQSVPPFADIPPVHERLDVVPMTTMPDLVAHFTQQAQALSAEVLYVPDAARGIQALFDIIAEDRQVLAWDAAHVPLPGLDEVLSAQGISRASVRDSSVRVGITGVDAALASTGSLVLASGTGKARTVSLLPEVHIAVLRPDDVYTNLEQWVGAQAAVGHVHFSVDNCVIITGASRTADIGMELVLGAHGPRMLYCLIVG